MFFRSFTDENLAQYAYLVGCQQTGEAIVIDPPRNIEPIVQVAAEEGLEIIAAADTHIHADYVSGARQLAMQYGATLYLSDEGDENWKYEFPEGANIELVKEGSTFSIGNVDFEVMYTPGHTPESVSFILTDRGGGATEPMGIFTGDFVFVGDVGRPDLLEEAAGMIGTADSGARDMFKSVQRFKQLPDHMIVWPAHGAGSACGKSLGAVPMSTVGYEKQFNWALQIDDEETFVRELLAEQPEAPVYFAEMKRINKIGPKLLEDSLAPTISKVTHFKQLLEKEDVFVIDTRDQSIAQKSLIEGTVNIPFNKMFTTWAGWLANYDEKLVLIAAEDKQKELTIALESIGLDHIHSFVDPQVIDEMEQVGYDTIPLDQFVAEINNGDAYVVDVRNLTEWNEGHFEQANHHFIGYFRHIDLPVKNQKIMVYCETGARSAIAASILKSQGYEEVKHMTSSYLDAVAMEKVSLS